jgi:hypothetical protein
VRLPLLGGATASFGGRTMRMAGSEGHGRDGVDIMSTARGCPSGR